MLHEGLLLLKKVENVHLETCEIVQAATHKISALFERFIPVVQRSKVRQISCSITLLKWFSLSEMLN